MGIWIGKSEAKKDDPHGRNYQVNANLLYRGRFRKWGWWLIACPI